MGKIKVYKLVRLGQDGDKFKKNMIAKELRTNAKLDEDFVKEYNKTWDVSGHLYILNEEATKKRDEKLKKKEAPEKPKGNGLQIRNALKKEADELGLEYPKNTTNEKLAELISDKKHAGSVPKD